MSMSNMAPSGSFEIKGWHVLAAFIGFFGVIFIVNGIFLYQALSTHTGVISKQPYRKGLAYNERIDFARKQDSLGWQQALTLAPDSDTLVFSLKDRTGLPVTRLKITGFIGRPSTNEHDVAVALAEAKPGHYEALVGEREPGSWMVELTASQLHSDETDTVVYRVRERLWLKP